MQFGAFELTVIRESTFKLDGGAMFGVVRKTLWGKVCATDQLNRVELACNLLLIRTPDECILVETGMGPRWSEKERQRFELDSLIDPSRALASVGLKNEDVDAVLISHMHFDHLGGAVIQRDGQLVPAFPKAKVYVQKGEYELARKPNARARASYRAEDYQALEEAGLLTVVDGDFQVSPGIWLRVTGGHTSHHQVITFESEGSKGVFFADIVPTKSHLPPPWVMGYDHFPLDSCDVKEKWLAEAAAEHWLVVFDHEPAVPWGYVETSAAGKLDWQPLPAETLAPSPTAVS